jgi:hypothetical protein
MLRELDIKKIVVSGVQVHLAWVETGDIAVLWLVVQIVNSCVVVIVAQILEYLHSGKGLLNQIQSVFANDD